jgi:hypothetical protein
MTAIIAVHNWRVGPRFLDDPVGMKGQHDLVHTRQPPLALLDDLRLEVAVSAARDLEPDVAVLSVSVGLGPGPVAAVAGLVARWGVIPVVSRLSLYAAPLDA